jgi:hypothetical protein
MSIDTHMSLDTVRCPSCVAEVPAGRFCEECGGVLYPEPTAAAVSEPEGAVAFESVRGFGPVDNDLGLRITRVRGGSGLVAESATDLGDTRTFAGQVRVAYAMGEDTATAAVDGLGTITFTPARVFGVLTDGRGRDGTVRLKLDRDGDGTVALFSLERGTIDELDVRRDRTGRTTGVSLVGGVFSLVVDAHAAMAPDGSFQRVDGDQLVAAARSFTGAADAPAEPSTAVLPPAPTPPAPAVVLAPRPRKRGRLRAAVLGLSVLAALGGAAVAVVIATSARTSVVTVAQPAPVRTAAQATTTAATPAPASTQPPARSTATDAVDAATPDATTPATTDLTTSSAAADPNPAHTDADPTTSDGAPLGSDAATTPARSPRTTIRAMLRRHFTDIADGELSHAYRDLAPTATRAGEPDWASAERQDGLQSFDLRVDPVVSGASAVARIVRFHTEAAQSGCHDWTGSWSLVRSGGRWMIEKSNLTRETGTCHG